RPGQDGGRGSRAGRDRGPGAPAVHDRPGGDRRDRPRRPGPRRGAGMMTAFTVTGVAGLPEITPGADLAGMISDAAPDLRDGDIVVVTSKIVSKAEGRVIHADRERAIDSEAVRVVARRGQTRIVETRHGLVLA